MNESIFIAVIGIVGTLAGTVLGWLLNNISRHGKLKGFVVKWDEKFELNETGLMVFAPSFDKAEVYSYSLALNVYNSSSDTRIMQDFKIEFLSGRTVLLTDAPMDTDSVRASGPISFYSEMETLNVPPKSVVALHLNGGFWRKDRERFDKVNKAASVRIAYKDEKGRDRYVGIDGPTEGARFDKAHLATDGN